MTVVTPTAKKLPGLKLLATFATPDASLKVGSVQTATVPLAPKEGKRVWEAGQLEAVGPAVSVAKGSKGGRTYFLNKIWNMHRIS